MTAIVRELNRAVDLLALHHSQPARYPHLLQSTAHGRYDILFACPGETLELDASGNLEGPHAQTATGDFLDSLDCWWQSIREAAHSGPLPFSGGWFVYLGYELAGQVEARLRMPAASTLLPVAMATRFATAVIHDHETGHTLITGEPGQDAALAQIEQDIAHLSDTPAATMRRIGIERISEDTPQQFLDAVARIHDYIVEGDVFQVNLSRAWHVTLQQPVATDVLFSNLRIHNPSPFSGLATLGDAVIISSSPERLVSVHNGRVETRPIAGTRPRGNASDTDLAYSRELLAHPKERAEHIMLIDLERNDLGRICVPGTIEVNELMGLESYAHVHHIVSNVRGQLREDVLPGQVLRAVFPGGTITGCPKVRCMEIIAELEQQPRGAYTGSMGYLNCDGSMDMNILIRTMVSTGRQLELRAGAGIVADSVAQAELEETRAKARGLLRALGVDTA
ncbi:MAG: aminodeoxychorismate synthase component I [Gammaproteobacteria bacterium]|nr:aminodeoxychorismate synthase component I [Gammaproteobacteria bacterium]